MEQTASRPIIVGVALRDDDRAPLALARALAEVTGAPIALATTYPNSGEALFFTPESITGVHKAAEQGLEGLADSLGDGIDVSTHVRPETSPAFGLQNLAVELDAAAIVVGSTHRGRIARVLAGDVGANLLYGAPCPVAIAPRAYESPEGFRHIGVAFLDTPEGRAALDAATEFARASDANLVALTVLEPVDFSPAMMTPGWDIPLAHEEEREERAQATADTAHRLLAASQVPASSRLLMGDAGRALAEASSDLDLLVCGSRGYGAVRSVVLGSVSRGLTHSSACPLVVVPRPQRLDHTPSRAHEATGART